MIKRWFSWGAFFFLVLTARPLAAQQTAKKTPRIGYLVTSLCVGHGGAK